MSSTYCKKVTSHRVRKLRPNDRSSICCKLTKATDKARDKEVCVGLSIEYAVDRIMGDPNSVILDESYLVCYSVVEPWYKDYGVVVERLVLKLDNTSSFDVVCEFLEDVAREHGCNAIVSGGALAVKTKALKHLYEKHGFVEEDSPTFIKRVD